jgi:hypothetical protein
MFLSLLMEKVDWDPSFRKDSLSGTSGGRSFPASPPYQWRTPRFSGGATAPSAATG